MKWFSSISDRELQFNIHRLEEVGKVNKEILGYYKTVEDTLAAVEAYALEGHRESSIVIFTKEENAPKLEGETKVQVKIDNPTAHEDEGTVEKMKEKVTPHGELELNSIAKLKHFGLTQEDAEISMEKMNEGHFVILIDERQRMGQPHE